MPFLSAVVTFIRVCSSRQLVQRSLGKLESSGGIGVYWVSWGRRQGFPGVDMEARFWAGCGLSTDDSEVA